MTTIMSETWSKKNQQYLMDCIEEVKTFLRTGTENPATHTQQLKPYGDDESFMSSIDYMCKIFGLSAFERSVLLMCTAAEIDSETAQLFVNDKNSTTYPTFSFALSMFPDAHWSALAPTRPLRKFHLIDILGQPQIPLTKCQLQINERVLHYLTGIFYPDESLKGIIEPIDMDMPIVDSQRKIAETILNSWENKRMIHVQLAGNDETSKKAIASWVCKQLGVNLWQMPADLIPSKTEELNSLAVLWTRESALLSAVLYVTSTESDSTIKSSVKRLLSALNEPVFVSTDEQWQISEAFSRSFEVSKPTKHEQKKLWETLLADCVKYDADKIGKIILRLVNQFDMNASSIQASCTEALVAINRKEDLASLLWSSSLKSVRPRISELAVQIMPNATMDDLVLLTREKNLLKNIITNVRQRYKVYDEWGFRRIGNSGLGITALFAGESGTGKTMAAEVIASELNLNLFKIDLSMVVNKYIGETEKNLRKIFDAAEDGGTILFFDEADSLFGKRSDVKDSHDRYSNIEVGYLLQRMESYRGLAILTTNMKNSLDHAFLRRIRFIVNFPSPDEKSRMNIWKRVFPSSVPVEWIDYSIVAQLDITGGNIRNIALGAAFLAAEEGVPVNMHHIKNSAKDEYDKINRSLPNLQW